MIRLIHTLFICTVLLLPVGCSKKDKPAAAPQEQAPPLGLMTVVPDNVLVFAVGGGCDNLRPAFEKSILGRIWNDQEVRTFFNAATEQLRAKIEEEFQDANEAKVPSMLVDFAELVINRPIIAGAATKETEDGPPVYGFVILDAGPRKAEIAAAIDKLQALDKEGDIVEIEVGPFKMHGPADNRGVPGYWGWVDNHFVFAVNDGDGMAIKRLRQPRTAPPRRYPTSPDH